VLTLDRQLRYFVKIAEVGSLSRAAADLECTQSILSRQLASLEADLGHPLFNRTGRGLTLTDAGTHLFESVRPALQAIDEAVHGLRSPRLVAGTLRLASVHTMSYYFVGDVTRSFTSEFPAVSLSLMARSSADVVELVESRKADVGFVYDTAVASCALRATPLFDNRMCLVARAEDTLPDVVDLSRMRLKLVVFPPQYALRRMLASSNVEAELVAEADSVDAMLDMVAAGVGCCILPDRIPVRLLVQHRLRKVRICNPVMTRKVVVIVRNDRCDSLVVQSFVDTALRVASAALAPDRDGGSMVAAAAAIAAG
jgi:DNA-binding transcriptional LysR family regulator